MTGWNAVTRTFTVDPVLAAGVAVDNTVGNISIIAQEFREFLVAYAVYRVYAKFRDDDQVQIAHRHMEAWRVKAIAGAHRHINEPHPMVPDEPFGFFRHPKPIG